MAHLTETIRARFGEALLDSHETHGDETVVVRKERIVEIMRWLRDDPAAAFNFMMDLTAVDYLGKGGPRFMVVYHLFSLAHRHRLRVKAPVEEGEAAIDSVTQVWAGADWFEREVWDLYGIKFRGHPNLKRILLYEEFSGHPLRKDYPLTKRQPLVGPEN